MYKLTNGTTIIRILDNANIPYNSDNRDYKKYLEWVALGNTPLPADQVSVNFIPLSRRQFFRALHTMDLLDGVNAIIANASVEAKLDFEHATTFERNDPTLIAMATALGKTDEDIDALFTIGATY